MLQSAAPALTQETRCGPSTLAAWHGSAVSTAARHQLGWQPVCLANNLPTVQYPSTVSCASYDCWQISTRTVHWTKPLNSHPASNQVTGKYTTLQARRTSATNKPSNHLQPCLPPGLEPCTLPYSQSPAHTATLSAQHGRCWPAACLQPPGLLLAVWVQRP